MFMIPRFDCAYNVHGRDIRAAKSAIVHDLLDACPGRSDLRSQLGQTTRPIADHCSESAKATICDQTALNHAAEHVRINIAAAKQENHTLSAKLLQFSGHARGERRGSRAFDDALLQFNQAQDRQRDLFLTDDHDEIDKRSCDLKCIRTDLWNCEAIRERRTHINFRWFTCFEYC